MAAEPKPRPAALRVLLSDKSQRQMVMSAKVNGSTSVPGNLCLVYKYAENIFLTVSVMKVTKDFTL